MIELIRKLSEAYGPSGSEGDIRDILTAEIADSVDQLTTDVMGNLTAVKKGAGPKVMLAAHMDEIGVVVTHIDEKGFLRFGPVGGVFRVTLIGNRVRFANGLVGVIGTEPRDKPDEEIKIEKLFIDIGAKDKADAESKVSVGDFAVFSRDFANLNGRLVGKALDDRIGCAILAQTLKDLKQSPNEVVGVFTTQEEVGARGAMTSAYAENPRMAIALDLTFTGDTPEAKPMSVALGKGPAIKVKDYGMLAHPMVKKLLIDTATRAGIPYQLEIIDGGTTDASVIQVVRTGVPCGVISIPGRYIHTPSEMVDLEDVRGAVRLLVELLSHPIELP